MPRVALTDRFCSGAKAREDARTDYFDEKLPGLALRVSPGGNKSWSYNFTSPKDGKRASRFATPARAVFGGDKTALLC